jgi:hypothetical protein
MTGLTVWPVTSATNNFTELVPTSTTARRSDPIECEIVEHRTATSPSEKQAAASNEAA